MATKKKKWWGRRSGWQKGAIIGGFLKFFIARWYLLALAWLISGYLPFFYWGTWGRYLWESTWWMIIQFPMLIAKSTMHGDFGSLNYLISYFILAPLLYLSIAYLIAKIVKNGN